MLNSKRSSARTGGPAVRLPSVSYWPPWQGQPKPAGTTGIRRTMPVSVSTSCSASSSSRPFGCTGQPRWTQRFERTVKLGTPSCQPVVADVRRAARDLALLRVLQEGRDHELALGEVLDRAEVDVGARLLDERRRDREAEDRQRHEAADHGAEAERRGLEELVARVALDLAAPPSDGRRVLDRRGDRRPHLAALRLDLGDLAAQLPRSRPGPRGSRRRPRAPRRARRSSS